MAARGPACLALLLALSACSCNEPRGKPALRPAGHDARAKPQVVLASAGQARVKIYAPERLFELDAPPALVGKKQKKRRLTKDEQRARAEARRLLDAVTDLSVYLAKLSGAEVKVARGAPAANDDARSLPILIGELGQAKLGPPGVHALGQQGFRVVVRPNAIGLYGESDLATGYAIYELLDRLGCRWYMPGELGEEIPRQPELRVAEADDALVPSTLYRNLWYADAAFKRRNRLGGVDVAAGHMLEKWVTREQREEHPEWRAVVKGNPHPTRLRWSNPEVADAIAAGIEQRLLKKPVASVSISPADGVDFDETLDRAIDGGDWDPTVNGVSLTDRLLVLANRVATKVSVQHPELTLGLLAYVSYTRPPVREKVHPNVVPVIAPITYCRPHPWSDDACPGARELRQIIEGWGKQADQLAFRGYLFNLAEPAAPNPMLRKWSHDLPFLLAHKVRFFQPETLPNFETSLPALYLGVRLSWNSHQDPQAILSELFERFYGHAGAAVRAYSELIDRAWVDTPEYSGGGLGHARRFGPELLARARKALDEAKRACATETESSRVALLDESLAQLELYMKMQHDLRSARLSSLGADYQRWQSKMGALAEKYAPNSAFGKTGWAGPTGVYGYYVKRFLEPIYLEADRIQREQTLLAKLPTCSLQYRLAPELQLPLSGPVPELAAEDKLTDVCSETWSTLGQYDYFGGMWYQASIELDAPPPGKRAFLWLSKVDGIAQAWVNGAPARPKDAAASDPASTETHLKALTFEVTGALHAGPNRVTIAVRRTRLAELGAGGLLGPIYVYRER